MIKWVDIDLVEEPLHLLRTVDTESLKYKSIRASMEADGFWESEPLDVSEDPSGGSIIYIVNEGMHRLTSARELGLKKVPVAICEKPLDDATRLERAFVANCSRVDMKPVECARAVAKFIELHKGITMVDLAKRLRRPGEERWLSGLLKLAPLPEAVGKLVDSGKIPIANGQALALVQKAGLVFDGDLLSKAERESVDAFEQTATAYIAARKGGKPEKKAPVAKLRPLPDVKAELDRARADTKAPPGYVEALSWVTRQDPVSNAAEGVEVPAPKAAIVEVVATNENAQRGADLRETLRFGMSLGDWAELGERLSANGQSAMKELDQELRAAIEAVGVKALAAKLGKSVPKVTKWSKGDEVPPFAEWTRILEIVKDPIYAKPGRVARESSS